MAEEHDENTKDRRIDIAHVANIPMYNAWAPLCDVDELKSYPTLDRAAKLVAPPNLLQVPIHAPMSCASS